MTELQSNDTSHPEVLKIARQMGLDWLTLVLDLCPLLQKSSDMDCKPTGFSKQPEANVKARSTLRSLVSSKLSTNLFANHPLR